MTHPTLPGNRPATIIPYKYTSRRQRLSINCKKHPHQCISQFKRISQRRYLFHNKQRIRKLHCSTSTLSRLKSHSMEHIFRNSVSMAVAASKDRVLPIKYLPDAVGGSYSCSSDQLLSRVNKLGKKAAKKHERLGPKFSEIVMRKLRMLQVGGVKKVFKHLFNTIEGEQLLKASHCYISTTSGPIYGLLFISSDRVAFCSQKSIKVSSQNGEQVTFNYKVMIPIKKINSITESENVMNPSEKYLEIVTKDNFEFWFMGFLNYRRTFNHLQQATTVRS